MFRQLLSYNQHQQFYNPGQQLYFPNITQFIKVQQSCVQKSLSFVPFIKINCKTEGFEFFLSALEEVKQERIKFVTRILSTQKQQEGFVEISQSPIQIQQGCNYFLLNAYIGSDNVRAQTVNKHRVKHQRQTSPSELIINLLYMISYWMCVSQPHLQQLLAFIRKQPNDCLLHFNRLSIVNLEVSAPLEEKKHWGRMSTTAAETKGTYDREIMMMQSDIFDVEFGLYDERSNSREVMRRGEYQGKYRRQEIKESTNKIVREKTPKHNPTNPNPNPTTNFSSLYFSRITSLETIQPSHLQKAIQQQSQLNSTPSHSACFCFSALSQLFAFLQTQRKLLPLQQLHQINREGLTSSTINQLLANYTLSLQQQYNSMDEQSIDQIKQLLDRLYQKTLTQFYQLPPSLYFTSNPIHEQQSLGRLLAMITEAQSSIFSSISKAKREMFSRRLSTVDDDYYCVNDRQVYRNSSKFENIMGEKLVTDQEIGFGLYRESIKQKLSDIFSDLMMIDYQPCEKKTSSPVYRHKSMNSSSSSSSQNKNTKLISNKAAKIMSQRVLANNMDRRIQILASQKRNLQQSLHYEERLQENLIQYVSGQARYQHQRTNRQQIQTISESEEEVEE